LRHTRRNAAAKRKYKEKKVEDRIVAIAGAGGNLGKLIAKAVSEIPGARLRLLVRPSGRSKIADPEANGAEIIEAEFNPPNLAAMRQALEGAYSVVSALQGGPDVIVGAQSLLLDAARDSGVVRFIPSDYSLDLFKLDVGENIALDWRRQFAAQAQLKRGRVEVVHVLSGCFLDKGVLFGFLGAFDLSAGKVFLWGEGDQVMDFTTYRDTAAYTAAAATDSRALPARFQVAGESATFHQLVSEYEAGSGRSVEVVRMGSLDDMSALIAKRQQEAPHNFYGYLPLMYWRAMLSGKGRLESPDRSRYPQIQPMGIEQYVRENLI
jgi:hypothetical protein